MLISRLFLLVLFTVCSIPVFETAVIAPHNKVIDDIKDEANEDIIHSNLLVIEIIWVSYVIIIDSEKYEEVHESKTDHECIAYRNKLFNRKDLLKSARELSDFRRIL